MDRRLTPFSGRIALTTLQGQVAAEGFTDGTAASVTLPLTDLLAAPDGARDRQVVLGDAVTVIDRRDGFTFVQLAKDDYCGWVADASLGPAAAPTHWVAARASHAYNAPQVQAPEHFALSIGARVQVLGYKGAFARTHYGYIPLPHLRMLGDRPQDAVAVAESLISVPYLWGGNSSAGIDCSGLVQAAYLACGLRCPADSDLQHSLGTALAGLPPLQRGDLLFWKGHVAMVVDATRLIHANAHSMSVAYEDIATCTARIAATGGGPVTARRRP
jgi:cell wall-associated NlpC family hydrolase